MTAAPTVDTPVVEGPGTTVAKSAPVGTPASAATKEVVSVEANSVGELLRIAVEKGTPVEQLEKLVDLHERMEARQAARLFFEAMARFQAECPSILKNREGKVVTNKGGSYSFTYADLDETVKTVRPLMTKHGLSFGWDHVVTPTTLTSVFTVRHEAGHSVTSSYTLPVENPSGMSPQQKVGAAQTFADRRSMNSGLGLTSSDEDPEALKDADPTPITFEQLTELEELIDEKGADIARFLKFMNVGALKDIRAAHFNAAITALKSKKSKPKTEDAQ